MKGFFLFLFLFLSLTKITLTSSCLQKAMSLGVSVELKNTGDILVFKRKLVYILLERIAKTEYCKVCLLQVSECDL